MGRRFSIEEIRRKVSELSDCELLETEYHNNRHKMRFRCNCGNEFVTDFNHFKDQGRRKCTECATKAQYDEKRLSISDIRARLKNFGCDYVSGEYRNQRSNIQILCRCGHERSIRVNSLSSTEYPFSGLCVECSKEEATLKQTFTVTEISVMAQAFDLELLSEEYTKNTDILRFRCRCGREFAASWNAVAQNGQTRCAVCSQKVSKGELAISEWLDACGIEYTPQKKFFQCGGTRPYPFDFYLPEFRICIEFDGEQHTRPAAFMGGEKAFVELTARDAVKNAYCEAHGLTLIRISYKDFKRIPEILSNKVIPR